jgi:hypothetical protein
MKARKPIQQELDILEVGQKPGMVALASGSAWATLEGDNKMVVRER